LAVCIKNAAKVFGAGGGGKIQSKKVPKNAFPLNNKI
jgi:hypothetical protein